MTTVREDILEALREYEEEERKRRQEEALRKAEEALEERRREEEERHRQEQEEREREEEEKRQRQEEEREDRSLDIAKEAGKGFIKGIGGAMFDIANGATFGGAKKFDEKYLNGEISKFDEELEDMADAADVGNIYRGLKNFNEGVGAGLAITGAKNIGGYGLNEAVKYNGRRDLIKQLERGDNFKDINFGKMDKDTLENINKLREEGGYNLLNQQTYIPANVVRKLYEKRLSEGYTPQEVTNIARDLFQKGRADVTESRYGHIQQLIQPKENVSDVGYVAQNPNNGQTVIKSVYKKPNKEIGELNIKGILDGRTHSSPAPSYQDINNHIQTTRPAAARFSALQDTMHNHITPINNGVNSSGWENLEKNFEDTSSVGYVAQNKFMPQNNLGQAGGLSQNPYSHILQSKREKEDLEELLRRLRLLRGRW